MKRIASALVITMLIAPVAFAAPQMEPEVVTGTVIDTACYAAGKHGPEEVGCTEMCLNMGVPASLLTDSGDVLVLLPPADTGETEAFESLSDFAAQHVKVTGMVMERDGLKTMAVMEVEAG